jgi:hypothetical protein
LIYVTSIFRYNCLFAIVVALSLNLVGQTQHKPDSTAPRARATQKLDSQKDQKADSQIFRNAALGFNYRIPYGWVDRTNEMNSAAAPASKGTEVLLAIFERPPEATGDSINSGVVIASENAASYPGLKQAEDYLAPLKEVTVAKGFKDAGEPIVLDIESRRLIRADFVKSLSSKPGNELTMRQGTLILLTKGRILSFTFIADSEDALDELMDGLHFDSPKPAKR